jgi:hypothetical protein
MKKEAKVHPFMITVFDKRVFRQFVQLRVVEIAGLTFTLTSVV